MEGKLIYHNSDPPPSVEGLAILGLKKRGGFQNLQDSGEPFGLWRVEFSRGFGFRRKKSPLLALDNTNLTVYFQKINLQQAITSFPETNMVNTVK